MTIIHSHKKFPNRSYFLNWIASLISIYWLAELVDNVIVYYDSRQLSDLSKNWTLILLTFLISYILQYLSLIEVQVRVYEDRIEKGDMYPFLKNLNNADVIHKNDIVSIDIIQDSDRFFNLVITSVNNGKIQLLRNPNRLPLIREFNQGIEKEEKDWHQHKLNARRL